jgi:hypothetical protein
MEISDQENASAESHPEREAASFIYEAAPPNVHFRVVSRNKVPTAMRLRVLRKLRLYFFGTKSFVVFFARNSYPQPRVTEASVAAA